MIETEDEQIFGKDVWIFCKQHLRPHLTGWCDVSVKDKIKLDATTEMMAFEECKRKNYNLYGAEHK